MKRRNYFVISDCVCKDCGTVMPVPRNKGKRREKNHIKTMWCPVCKEMKNMVEVRDVDLQRNLLGEAV